MFNGAHLFNFNTISVNNMQGMFANTQTFNQKLLHFDTKEVTNMSEMFSGATAYNFSIGHFIIKNIQSSPNGLSNMLGGYGMNQQNYLTTLTGWWSQHPVIPANIIFTRPPSVSLVFPILIGILAMEDNFINNHSWSFI